VFVVASARKGFDPAQVLFEWDGVRRDTAPSREARQTAPTIPSRSTAGGGLGTDFDCDGGTICVATGQAGAEIGADMAPTLNCNHEAPYVAHSLRGEGFDASEDGTGRGTPLVPVGVTIHGTDPTVQKVASYSEVAQCLRARTPGNIDNSSTTVVQQPVAYGIRTANTSSNGWGIQEECTHTLDCAQGVAVAVALRGREGGATAELGDEVQNCLRASSGGGDKPHVLTAMQVRRLTPEECEALQGFPRSYTAIPWRGKPADQCPDGPRYKALGNSWAVPNVRWIGERIARQINSSTTSPHPAGFFKTTP
jgi:DNA (cytosine-5)-methyltransferase 1